MSFRLNILGGLLICLASLACHAHAAHAQSGKPPPLAPDGGRRVALVIGNGAYTHVSPLSNPGSDARLMAQTLASVGFEVIGGGAQLDLDRAHFVRAVQQFGDALSNKADVGLFYYAGHGLQVGGLNYLVPTDANPTRDADAPIELVDADIVVREMEGSGAKLNVIVLDACRNNPFGGRGLRAAGGGLASMRAPRGTLIAYATQPGNVARDGDDGHSPFTRALSEAMQKPGLDVFRTFNQVGLAVDRATGGEQEPWVSNSPIQGEFYFAGPGGAQPLVPFDPPRPAPPNDAGTLTGATRPLVIPPAIPILPRPGQPVLVPPPLPILPRPRPTPPPPSPPASAGDGCKGGFVWREATPTDHVCVTPGTRSAARDDNAHAAERVKRVNRDYGPDTCVGGYVWREVTPTDHVCVTPGTRSQAADDNAHSYERVYGH